MKKIIFIILILYPCTILFSQESPKDNEEKFHLSDAFKYISPQKKGPEEKKNFFNIFTGYDQKNGNTESKTLNYHTSYRYNNNITEFKIFLGGSYGKTSDVTSENQGTAGLNLDYYILKRLELFTFTFSEYNRITNLDHRNSSGLGAKFVFFHNPWLRFDISGAPLYQYEDMADDITKEWRLSFRGRILIIPEGKKFSMGYTGFYIPLVDDFDIYRVRQNIFMDLRIVELVFLRISYNYEFNTYREKNFVENPDLKKTDHALNVQLGLKV